jgi:acetyltransferase-like isoleucine patch superfamily enzyme
MMIHALADVKSKQIGKNTRVWQFAVIMEDVVIGENCNINCHTFIENGVRIGDNVTVKSGVYLWTGLHIENNVFIGPNVTFTNDKYPRSKQYPDEFQRTSILEGASIGAGAIILGGNNIGKYALIAAGSVVTKSVPAHAMVMGNPAKIVAWVDAYGVKMTPLDEHTFLDKANNKWTLTNNELNKQ